MSAVHSPIYSVTFLDSQNGWAAGQGPGSLFEGTTGIGTVYHTADGGTNWFPQVGVGTNPLFDIAFVSPESSVPEPSGLVLWDISAVVLLAYTWRRKSRIDN